MSSAAEGSSSEIKVGTEEAGARAGGGSAAASSGSRASPAGSSPAPAPPASEDSGFWSAAGEFDDYAAEEHASKVFALWELAPPAGESAREASPGEPGAEAAQWSAGASSAGASSPAASSPAASSPAASSPAASSPAATPPSTTRDDAPPSGAEVDAFERAASKMSFDAGVPAVPEPARPAPSIETAAPTAPATPIAAPRAPEVARASERLPATLELPAEPARGRGTRRSSRDEDALAARAHGSGSISTERSADVTGEVPALPPSNTLRNALLAVAALAAVVVIGGGIAMVSGSPEARAPAGIAQEAPTTVAAVPAAAATAELTTTRHTAVLAPAADQPAPAAPALAPTVPAPTASVAHTSVSPASAPVPPRPVELRRLRIRTIPAPATLEVDGHVVNNPYDARLPDHSAHHIVVRLDGYTEETFDLELTRDREIVLRLFPDRDSRPEPRSPEPRRVEPRSVQPSRVEPRRSESRRERSEPRTTRPRERTSRGRQGAGFVTESPY